MHIQFISVQLLSQVFILLDQNKYTVKFWAVIVYRKGRIVNTFRPFTFRMERNSETVGLKLVIVCILYTEMFFMFILNVQNYSKQQFSGNPWLLVLVSLEYLILMGQSNLI